MRVVLGVLLVLAVAAGVAGVTAYSYNLGLAQGVAQGGKVPAPGPGVGPYPGYPYPMYPYGYPFHGPFGFGFGFFGFLWTVLLIILVFALVRRVFWRGYGWGGRGHCGGGAPPWFEEWHRRAHESKGTTGTA